MLDQAGGQWLRARRCGGLVCVDKVFCDVDSKASSQRLVVATLCLGNLKLGSIYDREQHVSAISCCLSTLVPILDYGLRQG